MHLELWQWALGALGAFLVGLSKTGIPGLGILNVAIFALVFPARDSVGLVLVILICGDLVAVSTYRRDASWGHLWRLFPWAAVGVVAGYFALGRVNDLQMRHLIGVILLALVVFQYVRSRRPAPPEGEARPARPWLAPLAGITAGFTTMVANAGGPVMAMYFFAARFPVKAFLGTAAWFFAVVNLVKVPISVGLGIITPSTLLLVLVLVPGLVAGALIGRWIANRIAQRVFDLVVVVGSLAGAIYLIV